MERKWWTLAAVTLATFMLLLDITVVNVALPSIREDLGSSFEDLQWVVDAYALTLAAFVLVSGSLADRLGRKRVFLVGLGIFTIASALCALSTTPLTLNLMRALQGVGGAIMFAVSLAMLAQEFHGRERGTATAIYGASIGMAVAMGPLIGGVLTDGLGWEWIFWINIPIGIGAIVMTMLRAPESRDPNARGIDWFGLFSFSIANALLVFALLRGNGEGWGSTQVAGAFVISAVLFAAFIAAELRVKEPMLPLGFFRNRSFTGAQIGAFAISASMFALFLYITLFVQNIIGESALSTGLIYLPSTVVTFVFSGVTANLMARLPLRGILGAGLIITGIGLGLLSGREIDDEWTALLPGFILTGVGVGMINPVVANLALSTAPQEQAGVASGINDTFRQVGVATGVAAFGALVLATATDHIQAQLGLAHERAYQLAEAASSGPFTGIVPPEVARVAQQGYVDGLNEVLLIGAGLAIVGGILTFLLVRASDLISSGGFLAPIDEDEESVVDDQARAETVS